MINAIPAQNCWRPIMIDDDDYIVLYCLVDCGHKRDVIR